MFYPCVECNKRFGKQYTEECDNFCDYAKTVKENDIKIKNLQDELAYVKKERDAAIADITEFAKFYRRRTICDFCKHDSEEECCRYHDDNYFINDCFEWRGY